MNNKSDWKAWNNERQRFLELESQGWQTDIANLEKHISKLQEVAPKDKSGWMNSNALETVNKLKDDLTKAKVWPELV